MDLNNKQQKSVRKKKDTKKKKGNSNNSINTLPKQCIYLSTYPIIFNIGNNITNEPFYKETPVIVRHHILVCYGDKESNKTKVSYSNTLKNNLFYFRNMI